MSGTGLRSPTATAVSFVRVTYFGAIRTKVIIHSDGKHCEQKGDNRVTIGAFGRLYIVIDRSRPLEGVDGTASERCAAPARDTSWRFVLMMVPCRHKVYQTPEQRCRRKPVPKSRVFMARNAPRCTWPPILAAPAS